MPWYAKAIAACVAAYALSPIDLIPDFIPVLGQLDELLILPLGIWFVVRVIPPDLMAECRAEAASAAARPKNWIAAAIFITIWIALAALFGWLAYRFVSN